MGYAILSPMEIKRLMEAAVRESAKYFPVVTVVGPRQSGKTTLVKALFPEKPYVMPFFLFDIT